MKFPVHEVIDELRQKLAHNGVAILQAPPGAGKSTVVPIELMNEPWLGGKKILMLEPRRLATKSVAARMASTLGEDIGESIGYRIRFESRTGSRTRVEVVTEGILARLIHEDNTLDDVGMVIFDEFHERSLQADLGLALCLKMQQLVRPDLRILLMSATIDTAMLGTALSAPVVSSLGRQYPVDVQYAGYDNHTPLAKQVVSAVQRALLQHQGDILVFLPGTGDIKRVEEQLQHHTGIAVTPLYGDLPFVQQQQAILPNAQGMRKVVLATSIAETSLTIEGITVVVDSGFTRVNKFDPRSGLTRLETVRISKDAADQRAGRAGRLGPGICIRLWTEGMHVALAAQRKPEIADADLAALVLDLADWGEHIHTFFWITTPPPGAVAQASQLLHDLEALNEGIITKRGRQMLRFPTHPRLAHMFLEAQESGDKKLMALACDLAPLFEERDPLPDAGADITLRIEVLRRYRKGERVAADRNVLDRLEKVSAQWRKLLRIDRDDAFVLEHDAGRLIFFAYPERVARQLSKNSEQYKLSNGRAVRLPPNDALTKETWLAIAQLDAGVGEGKIFLAAPLNTSDIEKYAHESESVYWDEDRDMIAAVMQRKFGPLVLHQKPLTSISSEQRTKVIAAYAAEKGLRVFNVEEVHEQWIARILSLRAWRTNESWPDVSETILCATAHEWLAPFVGNISKGIELRNLDLLQILQSILPWELSSKLDTLAPTRLEVPSGSMIKIQYDVHGGSPIMEVRLQEVFGLLNTPTVNEGRTKILMHLLSPGYKPVQVTQDLQSFWKNTYHEVRKELRTRYPKHSWPDDPFTAQAVRGVKRRT